MDVWQSVAVLGRRWYLALPTLLLGLTLAGFAFTTTPLQYESRSMLTLTTPREGGTSLASTRSKGWTSNPMASFDNNLNFTAGIIIQEMNTAASAERLGVSPGSRVWYEVGNGSTTPQPLGRGPFIFVRGVGPTPDSAQDIAERVTAAAATVLAERQRELQAPETTFIEMHNFLPPTAAEPLRTAQLRATAAALGLAVLLSLAAAFGFESYVESRGRRAGPSDAPRDVKPTGVSPADSSRRRTRSPAGVT